MVRTDEVLFGELVDPRGDALREPPRVDEDDGRTVGADQLQQARIDRGPDAVLSLRAVFVLVVETRHVLDRHLDPDVHRLQPPGVDDGDLAVAATEEAAHLLQRALRRRQSDSLWLDLRQLAESLEAQRQVAATLGRGDGVDLVDDEPADRGQHLPGRAGQDQEKGLGSRDQDVRRVALHRAAHVGGCVTGADGHLDVRRLQPLQLHLPA